MSDKLRNTPRPRLSQAEVRKAADQRRWSEAEQSLAASAPLVHSVRNIRPGDYAGVALLATSCIVLVPALIALVFVVALPSGAPIVTAGVAAIGSVLLAVLGAKLWKRDKRSEVVSFGDLMLWSWVKHYHIQRRIRRSSSALLIGKWSPKQRLKILRDLNSALEHKDPETLGHSRRVKHHCCRVAEEMAFPNHEFELLARAAELHDVGKVVVPDHILRKPDKLTPGERLVVQAHAEAGAELVESLGNDALTEAVRHHHERWDGHGYPEGLSGTRIPLLARVIAVADTFDAITSARPYRERGSRAEAIRVLRQESGRQFDPLVVQGFVATAESISSSLLALPLIWVRRYLERALSWMKETGVDVMAPTVAASGAAIVVAASVIGGSAGNGPQQDTPVQPSAGRHTSVTAPEFPHDLDPRFVPEPVVLGRRIRIQERPPRKPASLRPPLEGTRAGGQGDSQGRRSSRRGAGSPGDRQPRSREDVAVRGDPQPTRGQDCAMPPASRGRHIHCGT